jgi:hypothetical protein
VAKGPLHLDWGSSGNPWSEPQADCVTDKGFASGANYFAKTPSLASRPHTPAAGAAPGCPATQPRASSRQPSSFAIPSPPRAITQSWFQAKIGRAIGASRFIQALVVRTFHSYSAAVAPSSS